MRVRQGIVKKVLSYYLGIGGFFFVAMELSYLWAAVVALFTDGFLPAMLVALLGIPSAALRMIDWLPALILWFLSPGYYSFGMWLAPGFYVSFPSP